MRLFPALGLNAEAVAAHEEDLRLRVRELPDATRQAYYAAFKREYKDPDTYAVLNWMFLAGLHHMYLGHYLRGAVNLVLMLGAIILLFSPLAALGVLIVLLILGVELMALFRAQTVVADHNNEVAEQILLRLER